MITGPTAVVVADADPDVEAGRHHPLHDDPVGVVAEVLAHGADRGDDLAGVDEIERDAGRDRAPDAAVRAP